LPNPLVALVEIIHSRSFTIVVKVIFVR